MTPDEARGWLTQALAERMAPDKPTANQVALLMAQSALETSHWQSMWGYNFGNVIVTSGWTGDSIELDDSGNLRRFRLYPEPIAGARDYVGTLWRRPAWRAGLLSGSPARFAASLKDDKPSYYEAPLARYRRALVPLWVQYGGTAPLGSGSVGGLLAIVAGVVGVAILAKR